MSHPHTFRAAWSLCLFVVLSAFGAPAHAQAAKPAKPAKRASAATIQAPIIRPPAPTPVADAVIDARLERFASANAGNPHAIAALHGAAAKVKRNPTYYSANGELQMAAMAALLTARFGSAGSMALPMEGAARRGGVRVAAGDVNGLTSEQSAELGALVLMEAIRSTRRERDSLGAVSELESLRMELAMDRLSKLEGTLSNLMKKSAETSGTLLQNIK